MTSSSSSSSSSIGYGQPAPSDDNSRLFTIFVIIIGIFVIIVGVNDIIHNNLAIVRNYLCKNNKQAVAAGMEVGDIYHYRRQLFYNFFIFALWIIIGAAVVKHNEDWSWTEGFYFIMETSSVRFSSHLLFFVRWLMVLSCLVCRLWVMEIYISRKDPQRPSCVSILLFLL